MLARVKSSPAADAILEAKRNDLQPSPEQRRELGAARAEFEKIRSFGWRDPEAACSKDDSLAPEAASGRTGRHTHDRADKFVERWNGLGKQSQRQYEIGDYRGYHPSRSTA